MILLNSHQNHEHVKDVSCSEKWSCSAQSYSLCLTDLNDQLIRTTELHVSSLINLCGSSLYDVHLLLPV